MILTLEPSKISEENAGEKIVKLEVNSDGLNIYQVFDELIVPGLMAFGYMPGSVLDGLKYAVAEWKTVLDKGPCRCYGQKEALCGEDQR